MLWPRSKVRPKSKDARFASAEEIRTKFAEQHKALYWTAFVITADRELASASIVDASSLAESNNYVFHEWLNHWAQTATVRVAAQKVQRQINLAAKLYDQSEGSNYKQDGLSDEQIEALHAIDPSKLHQDLDALARTVLILRGCRHASTYECTLLLKVPLRTVLAAYQKALQWYEEIQQANIETQRKLSIADSCSFGLSRIDLDPFFRRKDQINVIPSS